MWNETELTPELVVGEISGLGLQDFPKYDESSYSIFYSTFNPNSPVYTNKTDFGISIGMLKFCIEGVGIISVSILGLIGNVLSIIVLSSPGMRNPPSCFLLCLSICDTLTLIGVNLVIGIPSVLTYSPTGNPEDGLFVYNDRIVEYANVMPSAALFALSCIAFSGSTYFTMALTMERYLAVCRPMYAKYMRTWSGTCFISGVIAILIILYNLPRWWEYTYVTGIWRNSTVWKPVPTSLRMNPTYDTYYFHMGYVVIFFIVPICFLIVFNALNYRGIKQANTLRKNLSPSMKNENSLTRMLFGVVGVFLVCQVTPALRAFYRYVADSRVFNAEAEFLWLFMLIENSSLNFLIYCATGGKFRDIFCSMFCYGRKRSRTFQRGSDRKTTFRSSVFSYSRTRETFSLRRAEKGTGVNGRVNDESTLIRMNPTPIEVHDQIS